MHQTSGHADSELFPRLMRLRIAEPRELRAAIEAVSHEPPASVDELFAPDLAKNRSNLFSALQIEGEDVQQPERGGTPFIGRVELGPAGDANRLRDSDQPPWVWVFAPRGLPKNSVRAGVLASRWGREPKRVHNRLKLLRGWLRPGLKSTVVSASGTTPDSFVGRLCQLLQIPQLRVEHWPANKFRYAIGDRTDNGYAYPLLCLLPPKQALDEMVAALSTELRVLHIRPRGNIERIVKQWTTSLIPAVTAQPTTKPTSSSQRQTPHLSHRADTPSRATHRRVYLALTETGAAGAALDWLDRGCVGWTLTAGNAQRNADRNAGPTQLLQHNRSPRHRTQGWPSPRVLTVRQLGSEQQEFVHHFTRPQRQTGTCSTNERVFG